MNHLLFNKSTLQKGDYIRPIKSQPHANDNILVSHTSCSDYINKPTTPSTSLLVIQSINNDQILNVELTSQPHANINSNRMQRPSGRPPHRSPIHPLLHHCKYSKKC